MAPLLWSVISHNHGGMYGIHQRRGRDQTRPILTGIKKHADIVAKKN